MKLLVLFSLTFLMISCSNIRKEDLGLARTSPNEKVVEQRQPLIMPEHIKCKRFD